MQKTGRINQVLWRTNWKNDIRKTVNEYQLLKLEKNEWTFDIKCTKFTRIKVENWTIKSGSKIEDFKRPKIENTRWK